MDFMYSNEWLKELDVEGWRPLYFREGEPCTASDDPDRVEFWVVAGHAYIYFDGYEAWFDDEVVISLHDVANAIALHMQVDNPSHVHPVLRKIIDKASASPTFEGWTDDEIDEWAENKAYDILERASSAAFEPISEITGISADEEEYFGIRYRLDEMGVEIEVMLSEYARDKRDDSEPRDESE